ILHQISFDMLVPQSVSNYAELSSRCLLNRYAISYHYSLLALPKREAPVAMKGNFVAFAPVFSDRSQASSLSHVSIDSLYIDRNYGKLLPLPFTANLVRKMQREWGGSIFTEEQSTADAFRSNAAYHRIIHIGTHAEA